MTINDARTILNRVREGHPMSLAITTQALQRTGDIPELPSQSLRFNGDESCNDRAIEAESEGIEGGFSYSRYLDCPTNKGIEE
jgi:hypothetical protein